SGVQVDITYERPGGEVTTRRVHPLGLVVKNAIWYLIAGTEAGERTFRVSRAKAAELLSEPVARPAGFDLAELWGAMRADFARRSSKVLVRLRVEPGEDRTVALALGSWVAIVPVATEDRCFEAGFPNEWIAAAELARLGRRIEVLDPPGVREQLALLGKDLVELYS
ncbi:MAG: helix-turn-helix transcriptional regulator, partial [Acidimicrobiales bacterium]